MVRECYEKEDLDAVIYLVNSEHLKKKILEIDKAILPSHERKVFVGFLNCFLHNPLTTPFVGSNNRGIILGRIK